MPSYDPKDTRPMIKTRWPELDRDKTAQKQGAAVPEMQKPCRGNVVPLPEADQAVAKPIALKDAIAARSSHRSFTDEPLQIAELSYLLWATQGVRKQTEKASFRTVPSGGARHPFETYLFVSRVEGLEPGLYRYLPFEHALCVERLISDFEQQLDEALLKHHFGGAVDFVWAAVPYRCEWRYAFESLRLILMDAGHVCAHLYLACEDLGCGTCAVGAYDQEKLDALIGLDGENEFAVYAAPVGKISREN